ncbi:MAG TPA: hypothetical protein PKK33_03060 [Candidatus Cloacimonadota bacterium]|nr:hypothetical protein [Candidatus Cloacimonadota bacterium]
MENEVNQDFIPQVPTGPKFDRRIIIRSYRKKLKPIVILTLIAMALAAIMVKIAIVPVWKANCYLIRYPKNMSTPSEMPYLYQSFDLNTILETVRTRNVVLEVIRRLHLKAEPEDIFGSIEVERGNRSNVLNLSVRNRDPKLAADMANMLAVSFIENNNKLQNSSAVKLYQYYLKQRDDRMKVLDDAEKQAQAFRDQHGIISLSDENQNKFDLLKSVELKKIENDLSINELNTKINDLDQKIAQAPKETVQSYIYSSNDDKNLNQLQKELELLRTKYTDENPKVQKVKNQIADLTKIISANKGKRDVPDQVSYGPNGLVETFEVDKTRYEGELKAAQKGSSDYNNQVNQLRGQLEGLSQMEKDYMELQRSIDLNKDVLRTIEGRIAESKMALESNVSDFDILERARPPKAPEGTRRKVIVVVIGFFVFALGSFYVIGKELLDFSMKSEVDFLDSIGIPMIGQLPDEEQVDNQVFYRNLQILLDNLLSRTQGKQPSYITVSSDVPETGKTFIIQEMLKQIQDQGKKIIYIDTIMSFVPELEPYIINDALFNTVHKPNFKVINENVRKGYFYTSNDIFKTILTKDHIQSFFSNLKDFDMVIWETFDMGYNMQLFATIAGQSDITVFVNRFRHSGRYMMKNGVEFLQEKGIHNIVGILNYIDAEYFDEKF